MAEEHAELLEWYFGEGRAIFGRSTCGAIIDRLQMIAFGSDPCKDCRGSGFCGGWSYGEPPRGMSREAEIASIKKAQDLASLLDIETAVEPKKKGPSEGQDPDARCPACRGSGVTARTSRRRSREPITVRPKPPSHQGGGYLPTDFALQHYAVACRQLDLVHRVEKKAATVLEVFFGDWGGRWADTEQGRLFAVYAFTAAGHKLLRMSRDKASLEAAELRPDEVLGVEFELQRTQPNRQRGDLFTAARDQAKRRLEQAIRVWNLCDPEREREALDRARREAAKKLRRDTRIKQILKLDAESLATLRPMEGRVAETEEHAESASA